MRAPIVSIVRRLLQCLALGCVVLPAHALTVEYIHTDALGTPVAVTNSAGVVIERSEYEPYGQLLNRSLQDGPGYTGHVQDAATGLSYMQQRYYDPEIGRFLSVDPVTANGNGGANFNRYWYANNNPYRFTDPDGRWARNIGDPPGVGMFGCRGSLCDQYRGRHGIQAKSDGGKKSKRNSVSGNHQTEVVERIDKSKWGISAEITPGNEISVDSKQGIIVQPRSTAWPPTFQFGFKVTQRPLAESGEFESIIAPTKWFVPEFYSSGFTGSPEEGGILFTTPVSSPGGSRWFIEYPSQESSHDNVSNSSIIIYTPFVPGM